MTHVILNNMTSLQNETTALAQLNNNFDAIETAFDRTLSRDGTAPNQMDANLDMNSFQIINLPSPITNDSPVRLSDVSTLIGGGSIVVSPLPTGGATGTFLVKNSPTNYDVTWSNSFTGLPITSVSGLGAGVANFLQVPSSANLATAMTDETGTGNLVFNTSPNFAGTPNFTQALAFSGDITPPQITLDQNDYNPTGLATATVLRISTDSSHSITGLQGGSDGRVIYIYNIGTQNLVLIEESTLSAATNRFSFGGNLTLTSKQGASLIYDFTSGRWRLVGSSSGGGSGTTNYTTVNTIAELRLVSKTTFNKSTVLGYYTVGDCMPRSYWYDSSDTTTADNGGSVIVAADGGRWKIVGTNNWTMKMFGAKDDGTDATTQLTTAISAAAAANIPLEWDGNFSTATLVVTTLSGINWIGKGGLVGIAASAQDAVLQFINCTDVTINGRFVINGNYNTNYTYGIHGYTTGAAQGVQLFDITNTIIVGCKTAWGWGSTARPDDIISEINIRGGYTFGCPQYMKAIGTQTVINIASANCFCSYGNGNAGWQTLPMVGIEAQGASININGGEVLNTGFTADSLFRLSVVDGASNNQYGNITVSGALMELANGLCYTGDNGIGTPTFGAFTMTGCNFVHTHDNVALIQLDVNFPGEVRCTGNRGFCTVARTQFNISSSSTTAAIHFDLESFSTNFLQGYAGVSGGIQRMSSKDLAVPVTYTGTTSTQAKADSIITFNPSGTHTVTLLSPTVYPGRMLYLNNITANGVISASSNIILPTGGQTNQIFPANATGSWVILVSDTSGGNNWRVVSYSWSTPIASVNIVKFTSGGTYTVPSNLVYAIVEAVGSGGGGGGVAGVAATNLSAGGGGAGGYARVRLTKAQLGASQTVTIGAAGNGGAAGANNGTAGAACSLGTLCVAGGGGLGTFTSGTGSVGPGGAGGTGTTGDVLISGGAGGGGAGFGTAGNQAFYTGTGGQSHLSGVAVTATGASAGTAGTAFGGGGSGATSIDATNRAGGNGATGIIVITEFLS